MTPFNWFMLAVLAVIGWIAVSPDPLADSLRVRFFHAKTVLAKKLDSAIAREEHTLAQEEVGKAKGNQSLLELKDARNLLQAQFDAMMKQINDLDIASKNAASVSDTVSVKDALSKKDALELDIQPIRDQLADAEARVKDRQDRLAELDIVIKQQRARVASTRSRASGASGAEIDQMIADLSDNSNHEKAEELLQEGEAHAKTMRDEADSTIDNRRQDEKTKAYAKGAPQNTPSLDDRAAALIASFHKKS